jgi:hypothetical protein
MLRESRNFARVIVAVRTLIELVCVELLGR